jgi:hypothetical protein
VKSKQSDNFDFSPTIFQLACVHQDTIFIITEDFPIDVDNVFTTQSIIKSAGGFDLNEISYLAKFVDVIIGRKSGPFTLAHNKDVWYSDKKSLSFTYAEHSSHFVQGNSLPLRKYWSPATAAMDVIRKIEEVLND